MNNIADTKWHPGERKPADDGVVLVLARQVGLNDVLLSNTDGYVIVRWDHDASQWRRVGIPCFDGRGDGLGVEVKCWRKIPDAPAGLQVYRGTSRQRP